MGAQETLKDNDNNNINNNKDSNIIFEYENFYLIKDNNIYKFKVGKRYNDIIIKSKNYMIQITENSPIVLNQSDLMLDEIYEYIISKFGNNEVSIRDISLSNKMILTINNKNELVLKYNKENKDIIFGNTYMRLKNELNNLEEEIIDLKAEKENLKSLNNQNGDDLINDHIFRIINKFLDKSIESSNIRTDSYA